MTTDETATTASRPLPGIDPALMAEGMRAAFIGDIENINDGVCALHQILDAIDGILGPEQVHLTAALRYVARSLEENANDLRNNVWRVMERDRPNGQGAAGAGASV